MKNLKQVAAPNENKLILLTYWFVSNPQNSKVFAALEQLRLKLGILPLRIVCLNPFNSQEDIDAYCGKRFPHFEMKRDEKHSGLFYQVSNYPTFILMERSGKILLRQNGLKEDGLYEFETLIRSGYPTIEPEFVEQKQIIHQYINNLSLKYQNI